MNSVPQNRSEFAPSGIQQLAVDHGPMVFTVMPEIGNYRPRAEIGPRADDRIADITEMPGRDMVHQNGILDFDSLTDVTVVGQIRGAADVAVGTDFTVFPDHGDSFYVHPGQDYGTGAQDEGSVHGNPFADGSFDFFRDLGKRIFIDGKQVPGVDDHKGSVIRVRFDDRTAAGTRKSDFPVLETE